MKPKPRSAFHIFKVPVAIAISPFALSPTRRRNLLLRKSMYCPAGIGTNERSGSNALCARCGAFFLSI